MKKLISVLLAAATMIAAVTCGAVTADAATIRGDVNGDNKISLRDATMVQKINAGLITPTSAQSYSADFNANDSVELVDALLIQKYVCYDKETLNIYSPNREQRILFLEAVNADRVALGYDPIEYSDAMLEAGNIRAQEYLMNEDHMRPNGRSFDSIITECNLPTNPDFTILEKTAYDSIKGKTFYNNMKSDNTKVYKAMMTAECRVVCVGSIPSTTSSRSATWAIVIA